MDLNLKDKKVFVTGGSKGIGKAIVEAFVSEGARVAVAARTEEDLSLLKDELGKRVTVYQVDLSDVDERGSVFKKIVKEFGALDVLINNVGGSNGGSVMETELVLFKEAMELNFYSAVHFSKLAVQEMKKKKEGAIINISSIFGRESGGKPTYNSAKSAMISFTKSLADEVIKDGIRVNGVAPGAILHPSGNWQKRLDENPEKINAFVEKEIPAGRFGTAEEVANVVAFLASGKASWIVGATVNVDGGQSRSNF
ncbi:SDR family NAD(P)-dependent oxidoreductase [Pseudalkalibacillus caeni]|uniref:SDR family oxidoreductase n=1 Tax=Exobacillus caeni TaxID=2574798 RepID=A0A5R9EXA0_9BACL|nr:SDR family oxidoreductase [Pseudalkalibacillus caeni]TLS35707.1 SDR family oxidoreductase [Pseudalkalibacillus caeni]